MCLAQNLLPGPDGLWVSLHLGGVVRCQGQGAWAALSAIDQAPPLPTQRGNICSPCQDPCAAGCLLSFSEPPGWAPLRLPPCGSRETLRRRLEFSAFL